MRQTTIGSDDMTNNLCLLNSDKNFFFIFDQIGII